MDDFISFLKLGKDLGKNIELEPYARVIIAGMGGSGSAADLSTIFVKNVPITVVHDYNLPSYANVKTLVILISYSGNTEEMISLYKEAKRKSCQIVAITSGGKLKDKCLIDKIPYVKVPSGYTPRGALPYLLMPALNLLKYNDFDFNPLLDALKNPRLKEKAEHLAEMFENKIPLIYSSQRIFSVANRWKMMFNENAQVHAFAAAFPELNHNELEAFINLKADFYLIIIRDDQDSLRIKQRMELTKEIIKEKGVSVTEISITGKNLFNRILTEVYLGDMTSKILAKKYEVQDINLIEDFKKRLK